jgi:hypothetical protein
MVAADPTAEVDMGIKGIGDGHRGCWGGARRYVDTRDQGGSPVSGWRRRSLPVVFWPVRLWRLGWGRAGAGQTLDLFLGISAPPPHVSLVPWSAAAGDGPALLSHCPPHCRLSWMWPMLQGAWSRDNQLAKDDIAAASDFSVLTGGVGACRCA